MKLAIISDTHDNLTNLDIFLAWEKNNPVDAIIHCGDVTSRETINYLATKFTKNIFLSFGNSDFDRDGLSEEEDSFKNLRILDEGEFLIVTDQIKVSENLESIKKSGESRIAFLHYPIEAKVLARSGFYDWVFYGHTHKPWLEKVNQTNFANAGNLANVFYPPSFAVLDTATNELKLQLLSRVSYIV
jgi:hypothetical protein